MTRPDDNIERLRALALAFPETVEVETWGHPTFRVRTKIFVGCGIDDDGRATASMKAAPGEQRALLASGEPFFLPAYVGSKGWIGIDLDAVTDWQEVAELVEDSYRQIAPRSLGAQLG